MGKKPEEVVRITELTKINILTEQLTWEIRRINCESVNMYLSEFSAHTEKVYYLWKATYNILKGSFIITHH